MVICVIGKWEGKNKIALKIPEFLYYKQKYMHGIKIKNMNHLA